MCYLPLSSCLSPLISNVLPSSLVMLVTTGLQCVIFPSRHACHHWSPMCYLPLSSCLSPLVSNVLSSSLVMLVTTGLQCVIFLSRHACHHWSPMCYLPLSSCLSPLVTTDLQCPRSSTATSHVIVSTSAVSMSRTLACIVYLCSRDTDGLLFASQGRVHCTIFMYFFGMRQTISHLRNMAESQQTQLV